MFHPYRTLLALCKAGSTGEDDSVEAEAGEVGIGIGVEDGPRYWGTGEGKLEMSPGALQTAWFVQLSDWPLYATCCSQVIPTGLSSMTLTVQTSASFTHPTSSLLQPFTSPLSSMLPLVAHSWPICLPAPPKRMPCNHYKHHYINPITKRSNSLFLRLNPGAPAAKPNKPLPTHPPPMLPPLLLIIMARISIALTTTENHLHLQAPHPHPFRRDLKIQSASLQI